MAESVSSGLGRTGPWLQNAWLRVETRLEEGSISPVALDGAFRPLERAVASVRLSASVELPMGRADYDVQPHADALGRGRRLTLTSGVRGAGATLLREIALYDAHPFLVTRLGLTNTGGREIRVESMHVFGTPAAGRGRLQFQAKPADLRLYRHGWQSWSPTMSLGGADRDLQSSAPVLSPEPPSADAGRFACDDVGVLFDPVSGRSLLAGSISARDYISRIIVDVPGHALDAYCLTDGTTVAPGETIWSEGVLVDLAGRPNAQLERYGEALGREMGARVPPGAPSGWCSWYYFFTQVTEDDVIRNLRFLEQHRRELPVETVQIDDGYQADIGDWLTVNEKFPHGMKWLASQIRDAGYTPGLWLAPFLLSESSAIYGQHPDWVVRGNDGSPAVAMRNWERENYSLDGSHPEAQAWLRDLFRAVCDDWGYDYVKVDFLFAAAIAGRRHDPSATRISAYRAALQAVREGVGHERFILGCGSLMAPSVGYFDGNRIGPDVAPFWRFLTRAEREAPPPRARRADEELSAESAIRNTLTRSWMHGRLWANDPDCLLVRQDRTKLSADEVRTLAAVIGLSGGMVLISDDLDQVSAERLELMSMLLPPLPRSADPVDLIERDMPERYEMAFERGGDLLRVVGLFNFADEARDLRLPLPEGRWHVFEFWEERYRGSLEGEVEFALVAPHASRLVALRPDRGTPAVVGTTAHIGCGRLDITSESYDPDSRLLRVALGPAGRRERRVYIAGAPLEGMAAAVDGSPVPVEGHGGTRFVSLAVDAPVALGVRFGGV